GMRFRRQHPIGPYIVDFICLERRLIVEVDGGHHVDQQASDFAREVWLRRQGYTLIRFWNNDVLAQPNSVAEVILEAVRTPPSQPSPARGEGEGGSPRPPHPNLPPQGGKAFA